MIPDWLCDGLYVLIGLCFGLGVLHLASYVWERRSLIRHWKGGE